MPEPIHEVVPGLLHWTARHPNLGADVSSYYLVDERVLLDPLVPPDGLDWFEGREPRAILLTNRHHVRSSAEFRDRFGATIRASRPGMHELEALGGVEPFDFGDELPGDVRAHGVYEEWPDETALELRSVRALAVADGVVNYGGLGFVPDRYMGDDPEEAKRGLREGFARLAEEVDFDHLLVGHGSPLVGGAREALRAFAASR